MAMKNRLDALIEREVARGEAAKQLQAIAEKVPDFLEEFAREFLQLREQMPEQEPRVVDNGDVILPTLRPTEAILNWFETHREGTAGEVVKALADKIKSGASKPRVTIYSTLSSLATRGKLRKKQNAEGEKVYLLP